MENRRLGYIDALRGVLILLVIVYHLNSGGGERPIFIDFCWPFMMPGFFFVSGLVAYRESEPHDVKSCGLRIADKLRSLVIPSAVFYMLYALCCGNAPFGFVHNWGGYWFTPELFKVFFIYYICRCLFGGHSRQFDCALVAVSLLGVVFSLLRAMPMCSLPVVGYIVEHICNGRMFVFFAAGILLRKYGDAARRIVSSDAINASSVVLFLFSWYMLLGTDIESVSPLLALGLRWIAAPCTGLFIIVSLFYRLRGFFESEKCVSRALRMVGRRSLDIYMLHYFFLYLYRIGGLPSVRGILFDCNNIAVQFAGSAAVAVLVAAMCLLCSEIIRNSDTLAFWLLGGRRRSAKSKG